MAVPARPLGEPVLDQPGLVARCVVHDDMDVEVGGHGALHLVEERAELARPMPLHAAPDDRAGGGVEGGEQGGRAVALVIVAAPLRLARPHGQHRLGAVERLDLALLVDAEHQRAVRRVEIEADDVAHLVDELRVARQLEALDPVRLQAEGAPDTVHRRDARRPGQESVQRAFSYVQAKKAELGIARDLETSDMHVEVIDLLGNRVEAEIGVAFFVAAYSALRKAPVSPALLVLGDMSVQGNIKPLRSLTEPLQVAKDNGAKRALIPIENMRNFLDVSADIMEHVDPVFYGDPKTAALKVLGAI